jgi:hypothetical protein
MKYILTTGCSFTNNARLDPDNLNVIENNKYRSWPYYLQKELGEECTVLNYGGATNDNVSMCRIMLYHIDRLVKADVNPKDIKIIVQWSSGTRQSIYMSRLLDKFKHTMGHTLVYHNNWRTTPGVFYLTGGFDPPMGRGSAVEYFGIENAIKYWQAEVGWDNHLNPIMHWLETWLLLEKTCAELGIEAYYMTMWDTFSHKSECNFTKSGTHDSIYSKPTTDIWMDRVEVLKPYLDKLPIKSDRSWYHKDFKGLFEWAIDNRRDDIPVFQEFDEYNSKTFEEYVRNSGHTWGHPSAEMMEIFVKTELLRMINV